jgi:hypothetical protein
MSTAEFSAKENAIVRFPYKHHISYRRFPEHIRHTQSDAFRRYISLSNRLRNVCISYLIKL